MMECLLGEREATAALSIVVMVDLAQRAAPCTIPSSPPKQPLSFLLTSPTLAVNIAANLVSPANDFANLAPRLISFKTCSLITGLLGIADDAVEAARQSVRVHRPVVDRLFCAARADRRDHDRRLLGAAARRTRRARSLPHLGPLRGGQSIGGHRACAGRRPERPGVPEGHARRGTQPPCLRRALSVRVVRGVRDRGRGLHP